MPVSKALLLLLASQSLALPSEKQESPAAAGVLHLPLVYVPSAVDADGKHATRRQLSTGIDNYQYNKDIAVGAVIEVGTPPQKVIVEPDTGSNNFWVLGLQPGQKRAGAESTFFDQNSSSSLQDLGRERFNSYGNEQITTELYTDNVSFGGRSVGKVTLGVGDLDRPGTNLGRHVGVLGLLPERGNENNKDFILQSLLDQNIVKSKAFGLGVRKHGQGALTFGGYDTSKFSGQLEKLPKKDTRLGFYAFEIKSLSFRPGSGQDAVELSTQDSRGQPLALGVDSGSLGFYPVRGTTRDFVAKTGAVVEADAYNFPCDVVAKGAAFDFQITDNTVVSVPLSDFVRERTPDGKTCKTFIAATNRRPTSIWAGRQFLRRSYVVHDHAGKTMYVARGADCGSTVVAIDGTMPDNVTGKCAREEPEADQPPPAAPGSVPA
ncbi:peptidase A1family protein [Metarhizium robertsii]|uniref:Candidapepsin-4 n=2 Tax=Metarhizium robertsii TaxID=568076 RepID=E9F356_METRA|nr:candidapepsin-4 precursor [Metarhizium robertsii ARSEF 23]EFY97922.1 candidapepsin-4 precursor [Metarhizium robertsii ARSEF 23]EXV00508.1 peptidase A1family protein [Metarhizium robertsii]